MKNSIDFIYKQQKELSVLGGIGALLGWDQMTYMPPAGAGERAEQTSLMSKLVHERVISEEFWKHIQILSKRIDDLEEKDRNVVIRLEKDVEKARKIPSDYVERMAKTTTLAYQAWEKARAKKDFKIFAPNLEKIIELEKEYCDYIKLPGPAYNSLLDDYEEGMTVEKLKEEFTFLEEKLVEILEKIKSTRLYDKQEKPNIKLESEKQKKLCGIVFEKMILYRGRTRIDISTHPFTTSMGNDDVRITTNYEQKNPLFSFFSTVHEAGHAVYELGMPRNHYKDTVISDSPSLGLHESQSRFWENMVARNYNFWVYFLPLFKKTSSVCFARFDLEKWFKIVNQVRPSLVRVEADELTYCLHVILRFEIELGLIDDKIKVSELPQVWNEKMDKLLGVVPKTDKEGVLQDMHWSGGSFGYFPTYAIGTIYASQLFKKLSEENVKVKTEIEQGNFKNILAWLVKKIHQYGRLMTADEIIKNACGESLNSKVFVNYLKDKYFEIYEV
ncbi:MAG: carboxypeptidase M32 [Candidatus Thermoplasmatota archaeon]|nr:carboxypeptidase M32 [Candidatus Thermoplasmatota archaeon]